MYLLKNIYIVAGLMCLISCSDRKSSSRTILYNQTNNEIEIASFKDGVVDQANFVIIPPYGKVIVNQISPWGKTLQPSWGLINEYYDSMIVTFKSIPSKKAVHLSWRDSTICNFCIEYGNNRNISNGSNYKEIVEKKRRKYIMGYFEYTFTQEDYNFAKE